MPSRQPETLLSNNPVNENKITTLCGGKSVSVTKLDGSTESIFVKQLPARLMPDYAKAQDEEVQLIKLATGRDEAWCDTLSRQSHEQLVAEVEAANAAFFLSWFERRKQRAEKLVPGAFERAIQKI